MSSKAIDRLDESVTEEYIARQVELAVGRTPGPVGKQRVEQAVRNQLLNKAARMKASHTESTGSV